jgi:uncharacterized alkaline shock family protein YloU
MINLRGEWLGVEYDQRQIRRLERTLSGVRDGVGRVMSRAINNVASRARSEIVGRIQQQTGVKSSAVKKAVQLLKASKRFWSARIRITGRGMPLIWFGARQTRKGVSYRISSERGRELRRSSFIARMPNGHRGVFTRLFSRRLPIVEQYGPSIPQLFEDVQGLAREVLQETGRNLEKEVSTQVRVLLEQEQRKRLSRLRRAG